MLQSLKYLPALSRTLIFCFAISAIVYLFLRDDWIAWVALHGPLVTSDLQLWRLISYPFVVSLFSALAACLIAWFFGGELEQIVHTPKLTAMLGTTVVVGGILFMLISRDGFLYGPAIIGSFLLVGFATMWPERQLSVMGMFWVKAWVIALVDVIVMMIPMSSNRMDYSPSAIFAPLFGAISSFVMFYLLYKRPTRGGLADKLASKISTNKRGGIDEDHPKFVEKRIDEILDKIASKGMNSLSQEEKDFLLQNSKR